MLMHEKTCVIPILYYNLSDVLYFTYTTSLDISIYLVLELKNKLYLNLSDVLYFTNITSLDISIYLVLELKYTYTITYLTCCTSRIQHL